MKAVVDIEFMVSLFMFLMSISFITYIIAGNLPRYHEEATINHLRSVAFQTSELLVFDSGYPTTWERSASMDEIRQIGLASSKKYVLSREKLAWIETNCKNRYAVIKDKLIPDQKLDMIISVTSGSFLFRCSPPSTSSTKDSVSVTRYGVLDTNPQEIVQIQLTVLGS